MQTNINPHPASVPCWPGAYLDDEVYEALVVVAGDGCVGPDDQLSIDARSQVDVLSDRQPKDVLLWGEREAKPAQQNRADIQWAVTHQLLGQIGLELGAQKGGGKEIPRAYKNMI